MKQFFYGVLSIIILGIVIWLTLYFTGVFKNPTQPESIVDTLRTEITHTYTIREKDKITNIYYTMPDSSEYYAVYDTTLVKDKVTANIKTTFYHPQKTFDFEADFKVISDSVYVYKETFIPRPVKFIKPLVEITALRKDNDAIVGLGAGLLFKERVGIYLKAQSDLSYGLGISFIP